MYLLIAFGKCHKTNVPNTATATTITTTIPKTTLAKLVQKKYWGEKEVKKVANKTTFFVCTKTATRRKSKGKIKKNKNIQQIYYDIKRLWQLQSNIYTLRPHNHPTEILPS